MKIAVIGGGSAGYLAAANLTKYFPSFDLYHIYDSTIPTIGVGEGTTPDFPELLTEITGLNYSELKERCNVTQKIGVRFENWGVQHEQFMHNFYPIGTAYAYHISAAKLVELLQEYVVATKIDRKVIDINSNGIATKLTFADKTELKFDIAIDATGFPKALDSDQVKFSLIPTNAAFIRRGPAVDYQSATRSVARPHGWIFIIPLTTHTSYGYIYNNGLSSIEDIETDFVEFLREENINVFGEDKHLKFPNFTQRNFFDGSLFKIGNAASFVEPLEATAIAAVSKQIEIFCYWPLRDISKLNTRERLNENDIKTLNRYLFNYTRKLSFFVGWHYAKGSRFETKFWQFAKVNFKQEIEKPENRDILSQFDQYLKAGSKLPNPIKFPNKFAEINKADCKADMLWAFPQLRSAIPKIFAVWPTLSFAEVGYGMGYFS